MGHPLVAKIKFLPCIPPNTPSSHKICLTCHMAKFTRLPFSLSDSHATQSLELIHMDIWGPYKECTKGKYRYFLTITDDNTTHMDIPITI